MSVGQIIKFYRKEKGFTQGELAEIIGVSVQAISKWVELSRKVQSKNPLSMINKDECI